MKMGDIIPIAVLGGLGYIAYKFAKGEWSTTNLLNTFGLGGVKGAISGLTAGTQQTEVIPYSEKTTEQLETELGQMQQIVHFAEQPDTPQASNIWLQMATKIGVQGLIDRTSQEIKQRERVTDLKQQSVSNIKQKIAVSSSPSERLSYMKALISKGSNL